MKVQILTGLVALALTGTLAQPARADHRHHHGHGSYYGSRAYGSGYDDHDLHDAYDHGYGGYGYSGYSSRAYYGRNAYRHNHHAAEPWKFEHGGRHVIDRRHGHHR